MMSLVVFRKAGVFEAAGSERKYHALFLVACSDQLWQIYLQSRDFAASYGALLGPPPLRSRFAPPHRSSQASRERIFSVPRAPVGDSCCDESLQMPGDGVERQHMIDGARFDGDARHAEDNAGLFILRDRRTAPGVDAGQTFSAVAPHSGHDDSHCPTSESPRHCTEQV